MDNLPANVKYTLEQVRNQNQIATKGTLGITGTTVGELDVLFPDSIQRGYTYELTPINERPTITWQIPGVVALFSDGNFNFIPSFNQGRELAKDVKINVVASVAMKTSEENQELRTKIQNLADKVKSLEETKK